MACPGRWGTKDEPAHPINSLYQDLIETALELQVKVEQQSKKVVDLEDYVDGLLIKIMEDSPVLLEKNLFSCKPSKY